MPVRAPDRFLMTTSSSGTGDLLLDGAVAGFRTIQQCVADGDYTYGDEIYLGIEDPDVQAEWGVYTIATGTPPTLQRASVTPAGTSAGGTTKRDFAGDVTRVFSVTPEEFALRVQDLQEEGGSIPETDRTNDFTATQRLVSTAKTAGAALRSWIFRGLSSTDVARDYAEVQGKILTATNGDEDGALVARAMVNGALADIMQIGATGVALDGLTPPGSPGIIRARAFQDEFGNAIGQGAYSKLAEAVIPSGSPVSAVDFATGIDATYGVYEIHLLNVEVALGQSMELRFSNDGGVTFRARASDYSWETRGSTVISDNEDDAIRFTANSAMQFFSGVVEVYAPATFGKKTLTKSRITGDRGVSATPHNIEGAGVYHETSPINGFRVLGTGTFHGKVQLFGRVA